MEEDMVVAPGELYWGDQVYLVSASKDILDFVMCLHIVTIMTTSFLICKIQKLEYLWYGRRCGSGSW